MKIRSFGQAAGQSIVLYTLDNGQISVDISTFGGTLVAIRTPDRWGKMGDVLLGHDDAAGYENGDGYVGALIGRVGNRIGKGQFTLNGKGYRLYCNDNGNSLHGGKVGFDHKVWKVLDALEDKLVLTYTSEDGEEGYPGSLQVIVTYAISGSALSIRYQAESSAATPVNLTNHAYFNLTGVPDCPITGHWLWLGASHYTPVDDELIPTGEIAPVAGTPLDFTAAKLVGEDLDDEDPILKGAGGYDHNFVLDGEKAAEVFDPVSGRKMTVTTDMPCMQFYIGNFLNGKDPGKGGQPNQYRCGFCMETQFAPDFVNHANLPGCILEPGAIYDHTTTFTFAK